MPRIWICKGYAFFSLFHGRSVFRLKRIGFLPHSALRPGNTTYATQSAAYSSIYCVSPLSRDRPVSTGKGRCGYSVTVLHFRKLRKKRKVRSGRKDGTVIRFRFYKLGCNYRLLKLHHEKDE
ncbi:hypothetical protein CSO39_002817 [Salmonella enterica subsp. arizonae]|nr:hypothetical protein [Salmonella enterica subsp. arizonae]